MSERLLPYRGIEPPEFPNEPWENALFEAQTQAEVDHARLMKQNAMTAAVEFGDEEGHPFHGNQYTGGFGKGEDKDSSGLGGKTVGQFVAEHPRLPGEDVFVWQGRIVQGLPKETQSDLIFKTRERYEPVGFVRDGINQWNSDHNLPPLRDGIIDTPADLHEAEESARYFEQTPDQSDDPRVQAAYADFREQSDEMYGFMTKPESEGGMGITVDFTTKVDPYDTAEAQAADLRDNHHITLQSGLGGAHEATMEQDEYDRFRAVHDVFGHAGIGGGFDRHGEYEAWLTHASMYTGDGRDAMSTEYHGVNSAMWSGDPGTPGTGKSILLPDSLSDPPWERSVIASAKPSQIDQLIDALGLDAEWATKFSKAPWHTPNVTASIQLEFGGVSGHPFHGNQYTGGFGGPDADWTPVKAESALQHAFPNATVDYLNFPEDQARFASAAAQGLVDAANKFPTAAAEVRSITIVPDADGTGTLGVTDNMLSPGGVDVTINTGEIALFDTEGPPIMSGQTAVSRYAPVDWERAAYGVSVHEFGHVVDYTAKQEGGVDVFQKIQQGITVDELPSLEKFSQYASASPSEAFAEAFTAKQLGVTGVPQFLGDTVKEAISVIASAERQNTIRDTFEDSVIWEYARKPITASISLELGDEPGHPFRGNQWTGGIGDGSKENPIHVSSAIDAAYLIGQGKYVQMPPDKVSILLDKLAKIANEAKLSGTTAPNYDLCKISVPDSNLFCAESKDIARIDMPQLATANPVPGSPADALPRNDRGWVDISGAFLDHLRSEGHDVSDVTVRADQLKATQNELNGSKVAGLMEAMESGKDIPGSVWASNDNYVLDGHHRWAAEVGVDYSDGKVGDITMPITRVDMPISVLLDSAKQFAADMGVPQAAVASARLNITLFA